MIKRSFCKLVMFFDCMMSMHSWAFLDSTGPGQVEGGITLTAFGFFRKMGRFSDAQCTQVDR